MVEAAPGFDIRWIDFAAVLQPFLAPQNAHGRKGGVGGDQYLSERLKQSSKRRHRGGYTT